MKVKQRPVGVETLVMRALHTHLQPGKLFPSEEDYLKFDLDTLLHSDPHCVDSFKKDLAFYSLLRKWKGFKLPSIDPGRVAARSWLDAERHCAKSNHRLICESAENKYSISPSIIAKASHLISQILGKVDFDAISKLCRFGSGATFDKKRGTDHCQKSRKPSVTLSAIPYVCRVLAHDPYFGLCVGGFKNLQIVDCNRLVMVPKNAKTHRSICAEPTLNGYVQQGVGRYIREMLKRIGLDLNDQTVNQDLAAAARFLGLATLDLAMASDTLCIELCRLLLPHEWFELLFALRCPITMVKHSDPSRSRRFHLNKFASMGNAYTFELESLIFYALVKVTCDDSSDIVSVFGDDLIVPDSRFEEVVKTLNWAGFKVNNEKSFHGDDRFRESCGKHFIDTQEVTPVYQKEVVGNKPSELVRFHNRLIRAGIRLGLEQAFEDAARVVRDYARSVLPAKRLPGIGPLVEYDEYFIKKNYVWRRPTDDRVLIRSVVTRNALVKRVGTRYNYCYYGRKLRQPGYLNPAPDGACADITGHTLTVKSKSHWRSATYA